MKVLLCGAGYVGLSNALLISAKHQVYIYDINYEKIDSIKNYDFSFLSEKNLKSLPFLKSNIHFVNDINSQNYDFMIIAIPTDLNSDGKLSISNLIDCIREIKKCNNQAIIVVKSTLPLGGAKKIVDEVGDFVYIPEFLREGTAVHDAFYPSRIIVGGSDDKIHKAKKLYSECILNEPEILLTNHQEAESIKLFSNTYLAMRVAFFNEIDTYMMQNSINAEIVIHGMGLDDRIGLYYNNPSFGFGGYCLPKDTEDVINSIGSTVITRINESNLKRINEIANYLEGKGYRKIGVYKLSSKSGASGNRNSAMLYLIEMLKNFDLEIYIYDQDNNFISGCIQVEDLNELFAVTDIVIANRVEKELEKYRDKVFTRDLFSRN